MAPKASLGLLEQVDLKVLPVLLDHKGSRVLVEQPDLKVLPVPLDHKV
jgi:hypothetical protein